MKRGLGTCRSIKSYLEWDVVYTDCFFPGGCEMKEKRSISYRDTLILAAARTAKARELWSVDLNPGQQYEGVVVVNPKDDPKDCRGEDQPRSLSRPASAKLK
jgi:hypothetical protein